MNNDTYNGWTNRETWALVLHMFNHEGLADDVRDEVNLRAMHVTDALKDVWGCILSPSYWVREMGCNMPEWAENALLDIGSLWRVDWVQVANAYNEYLEG